MLICLNENACAQDTGGPVDVTKMYRIELEDGSVFFGNVLEKDSLNMVVKTASLPRLEIPVAKIKHIEEIDESHFRKGSYWFPNPHSTRYLYGPSAYNLKKGEAYYQNTWLVLNAFNVGLTNNFSIGAGIELVSTFSAGEPIFFITPKVGYEVADKFNAGGGVLYVNVPGFDSSSRSSLGIAYAIGTYGTLDNNITGGVGWGFVEGDFQARPIITFSGMTRVSKKTALVTENWLIPADGYYGLFSYGIRFFGETIAVDLAFVNNADIADLLIIGIPFVGFTVKL